MKKTYSFFRLNFIKLKPNLKWFLFIFLALASNFNQAQGNDIVFFIDNSKSIDSVEYNNIKNSVNTIISNVLACPNTRVAIVHYGKSNTNTICDNKIHIQSGFTNNINTAVGNRPLFGNDNLHLATGLLGNALDGQTSANNQCIEGVPLNFNPLNNLRIFIFSDGSRNNGISSIVNTSVPSSTPPGTVDELFQEYLNFKTNRNARFYVLHNDMSNSSNPGQFAAATIASSGGNWPSTNLEGYPSDPDNGQNRYFYDTPTFTLSQTQIDQISNDLCTNNTPNPCNDVAINITTQLPNCNIFENGNTFDICGTFQADASASSSLTLLINNSSTVFPTILPITNIFNPTTINGVTTRQFCVTLDQSNFNNPIGNYSITAQLNSQINGQPCPLINSNIVPIPLDPCINACPQPFLEVNPVQEDCTLLGDDFSFKICGSYCDNDDIVLTNINLNILDIDNNDIINSLDYLNFDFDTNNNFCATITHNDFLNGLVGTYDFVVNAEFWDNTTSTTFTLSQQTSGLSFEPCVTVDPCEVLSLEITTQIPECNIFQNNSTFEVCGSITYLESSDITSFFLTVNSISSTDIPITPVIDSIDSSGVVSASFCVFLNESDFNPNLIYHMSASIYVEGSNGKRCKRGTEIYRLPLEPCTNPCEDAYISITTSIPTFPNNPPQFNTEVCVQYAFPPNYVIPDGIRLRAIPQTNGFTGFEIINFNPTISSVDSNGISYGSYCFIITESNFTSPLEGNYQILVDAHIGVTGNNCENYIVDDANLGFVPAKPDKKIDFKFYPNPVKNKIFLSSDSKKISSVAIYNLQGLVVIHKQKINISLQDLNVTNLKRNIYFIKVTFSDGNTVIKRFIKE